MNKTTRTALLIVAGLVAAFIAVAIKNRLSQPPEQPVVEVQDRVLVAKRDLAAGSFVQPQVDLEWAPAPEGQPEGADAVQLLHEGSVRPEDFAGAVVRRPIHQGDVIPQGDLVKAGSGGLMSAVLDPRMRAVSISVTATSGNAGFVLPGDYVDLILTREAVRNTVGGGADGHKTVLSKTFIENVRVLAADQMLDNPDSKALLAKTITIEVTPQQAQMIAVAAELGKISLSLRSAVNAGANALETKDVAGSVSDADIGNEDAPQDVSQQVRMMRMREIENLEFYKNGYSSSRKGAGFSADLPIPTQIPGMR